VGEGGAWLASEDTQPEDEGALPEWEGKEFRFGRSRDTLAIVTSWSFLAFLFLFCVFFAENSQLESAIVSPNAYRFY
jgi:hypothetical protein